MQYNIALPRTKSMFYCISHAERWLRPNTIYSGYSIFRKIHSSVTRFAHKSQQNMVIVKLYRSRNLHDHGRGCVVCTEYLNLRSATAKPRRRYTMKSMSDYIVDRSKIAACRTAVIHVYHVPRRRRLHRKTV